MDTEYYSPEEIGKILKIARSTVIKLILTRKLEAAIVGKQYRVSQGQLQDYLDRNTIKAG